MALGHPCVVVVHDVGYTKVEDYPRIIVVYERMLGGTLRDYINERKTFLGEDELLYMFS